jgi:hypothetical protein
MAQSKQETVTIAELVRASEASRQRLTETHDRVSRALEVPMRIKDSLSNWPSRWLGGSLVAGVAAGLLFRKGKQRSASRGLVTSAARLALTVGKPLAKAYAAKLLKDYVQSRLTDNERARGNRWELPPY